MIEFVSDCRTAVLFVLFCFLIQEQLEAKIYFLITAWQGRVTGN